MKLVAHEVAFFRGLNLWCMKYEKKTNIVFLLKVEEQHFKSEKELTYTVLLFQQNNKKSAEKSSCKRVIATFLFDP